MSQINPPILDKDVSESSFKWDLKNFCAMIDERLFNADSTTTKLIPISGIPFKLQLGMTVDTISEFAPYDSDDDYTFEDYVNDNIAYVHRPAVCFKLDFLEEGPVPQKYTKITCDFEIGSYWTRKVELFPKKTDQLSVKITLNDLDAAVDSEGTLVLNCRMKVTAYVDEGKPSGTSDIAVAGPQSCVTKLSNDMGMLLMNEDFSDLTLVVKDHDAQVNKPEAVEKLMIAKSKYDKTLQELQEAKKH